MLSYVHSVFREEISYLKCKLELTVKLLFDQYVCPLLLLLLVHFLAYFSMPRNGMQCSWHVFPESYNLGPFTPGVNRYLLVKHIHHRAHFTLGVAKRSFLVHKIVLFYLSVASDSSEGSSEGETRRPRPLPPPPHHEAAHKVTLCRDII